LSNDFTNVVRDIDYYINQKKDGIKNRFYVYLHRRLSDNKPFYVGKGQGDRAWYLHHRSAFWNNVVNKHGFKSEIVFDDLEEDEAFQLEVDTILEMKYFGNELVNLTNGGDGPRGRVFSEESRRKMSEAQKTSEKARIARELTRLKCIGRKQSEEQKLKVSKALSNKPKSKEHSRKVAESKRSKTVYRFISEDGSTFSGTRYEFEVHTGICRQNVSGLFGKKPNKTTNGWSLVTEENTLQSNLN
jgi:hypothetical protein